MMNTDTTKKPDTRIKVVCLECGKKFSVRVYANECPKCGGVDIDVR
jgi:Zn finger protein HypA/HybF involved in hydrogenase expression